MPPQDESASPHNLLLWPAEALVAVYVVLDDILTPIFQPLARWVGTLPLVLRLQKIATDLPPYGILGLLALPLAIAEPAKIYGLYLVGTGHWIAGLVVLALAYFVSLVVVERIYSVGKAKLRTIRWFASVMDWLIDYRDRLHEWARSTRIWAYAEKIEQHVRAISVRVKERARGALAWLRLRLRQG